MESDENGSLGRRSPDEVSPPRQPMHDLFSLVTGYRISQAIYVVAALGIPDLLAHGPRGIDELARETGTHQQTLYRVLRLLTGVGLFDEAIPSRFGLALLGADLRADVATSLRPMVLMLLDPANWQAWEHLAYSVRTGENAFRHVHGMALFEYLDAHPAFSKIFQQAMTSHVTDLGAAISGAYDFSRVQRLVDVGGGHGSLLAAVLQAYPTMHGVLFDRPEVVASAQPLLEDMGVAERCERVGGDFFTAVPASSDAYLLCHIIHDWDDAQAVQILENCQRTMSRSGRVLVVEEAITPNYREALPVLRSDLEMLVAPGGMERTEVEYRALFAAAGLEMNAAIPLGDGTAYCIFEGVPAQ